MRGRVDADAYTMGWVAASARLDRMDNPFSSATHPKDNADWDRGYCDRKASLVTPAG